MKTHTHTQTNKTQTPKQQPQKTYHPIAPMKILTTFIDSNVESPPYWKGMGSGTIQKLTRTRCGCQSLETSDVSPSNHSRGRIEPPSEGFWLVKMTQLVGGGGGGELGSVQSRCKV